MAIIRDQGGLAEVLGISKVTIWKYIKQGLPFSRRGFIFYFDTKEVSDWLKLDSNRAHLSESLEKYNEKKGE